MVSTACSAPPLRAAAEAGKDAIAGGSLTAFEKACGKKLPYVIEARRPGDIAECYADPSKAKRELGWVAEYGIEDMCADSWNWQKNNPDGYHTVK